MSCKNNKNGENPTSISSNFCIDTNFPYFILGGEAKKQ